MSPESPRPATGHRLGGGPPGLRDSSPTEKVTLPRKPFYMSLLLKSPSPPSSPAVGRGGMRGGIRTFVPMGAPKAHEVLRAAGPSAVLGTGCATPQFFRMWTAERLDCHPFGEFILSEAEGLRASAYVVARNDRAIPPDPVAIAASKLGQHPSPPPLD